MEFLLEAVREQFAEHRHLLGEIGPELARRFGQNIVVVGIDPIGAARDNSRCQIVGRGHQGFQGVIPGHEFSAFHADKSACLPVGRSGFDGGYVKLVECRTSALLCGQLKRKEKGAGGDFPRKILQLKIRIAQM